MTPRPNVFQAAPAGSKAIQTAEASIEKSGLEHGLMALVRLRVSQINVWNRVQIGLRTIHPAEEPVATAA